MCHKETCHIQTLELYDQPFVWHFWLLGRQNGASRYASLHLFDCLDQEWTLYTWFQRQRCNTARKRHAFFTPGHRWPSVQTEFSKISGKNNPIFEDPLRCSLFTLKWSECYTYVEGSSVYRFIPIFESCNHYPSVRNFLPDLCLACHRNGTALRRLPATNQEYGIN